MTLLGDNLREYFQHLGRGKSLLSRKGTKCKVKIGKLHCIKIKYFWKIIMVSKLAL